LQRSIDRILTTHVGSLRRPDDLMELVTRRDNEQLYDEGAFHSRLASAVKETVRQQTEAGIDIVNDGEFSKSSWAAYFRTRLNGIVSRPVDTRVGRRMREEDRFPEWFELARKAGGVGYSRLLQVDERPNPNPYQRGNFCVAPLEYVGHASVQEDIRNLKQAAQGQPVADLCLTALSPAMIGSFLSNDFYKSDEEYLYAIADAMREEYRAIAESGIVLQLDAPDLVDRWQNMRDATLDEYRKDLALRVDVINHALKGVDPAMVRVHTCWISTHFPHSEDLPLKETIDIILKLNVQGFSIEASNPRHEHEWQVFEDVKLPDGAVLIPGVIGHYSDYIEHPELVAQRLLRYANLVGRENVIAGVDCGLGNRVGHPSIGWAKFESMAEGARIASEKLWG
jgi:5-methyltetrahydropteroyltriglutamate--homocysteine methyltransferase